MCVQFKTPLGSQVYTAIFQPPKRNVAERFLPRRTAFAYDLDDDADGGLDIPTTLYRSKADCPKVRHVPSTRHCSSSIQLLIGCHVFLCESVLTVSYTSRT